MEAHTTTKTVVTKTWDCEIDTSFSTYCQTHGCNMGKTDDYTGVSKPHYYLNDQVSTRDASFMLTIILVLPCFLRGIQHANSLVLVLAHRWYILVVHRSHAILVRTKGFRLRNGPSLATIAVIIVISPS